MARSSKADHVKKICGCVKWKECAHPWHVYYREGIEIGPNGKIREKGIRCRLSKLVGREPLDYADAKAEARRAISRGRAAATRQTCCQPIGRRLRRYLRPTGSVPTLRRPRRIKLTPS
jgi:hypothetical protein